MHEGDMRIKKSFSDWGSILSAHSMSCAKWKEGSFRKVAETSFNWKKAVEQCCNTRNMTYCADKRQSYLALSAKNEMRHTSLIQDSCKKIFVVTGSPTALRTGSQVPAPCPVEKGNAQRLVEEAALALERCTGNASVAPDMLQPLQPAGDDKRCSEQPTALDSS